MCPTIIQWIKDNPEWVAFVVYSIIEHFLGRSKKVKSNSFLELLWTIATLVFKKKK